MTCKKGNKTKVVITTTKKYGEYLVKHLQKEHPKTKGKIKLSNNHKKRGRK